MAERLAGRTAVVVGGGQTPGETVGNGRAAAIAFAREGARVLVADIDPTRAEETASLIRAEDGDAIPVTVDITDDSSVVRLATVVRDRLGRLDVLHNNVGILGAGDVEHQDEPEWRRVWDVNLDGMWRTLKHLLPIMREQGSGSVINISSLASFGTGQAGANLAYSTSKAAVNSMSRALAMQYAPHGVRVNVITPGLIDTPMAIKTAMRNTGRTRDEVLAERFARIPMQRHGSAWEIAAAAVFLASDEASYVTGVVLPVDGGSSLTQTMPAIR